MTNSKITIQLIKSQDPTFESSSLSRAEAWKVYISSFETVYPTEGVDHNTVRTPFLRRALRTRFGNENGEPGPNDDASGKYFDERMQFRISATTYRMEVEPGSSDFLANASKVGEKEGRAETERRSAEVEERWRANSEWMKGRAKDEVDAKKQEFKEKFDEVVEAASGVGRRRS